MKKFIYLDIDGVLSLGSEIHPRLTEWGYVYRFNAKAVNVLNEILENTNADIIISSDWKLHYSLKDLQNIFEWQGVIKVPIDITKTLPFAQHQLVEEERAKEILNHMETYRPGCWVAVDDFNLQTWISTDHFVHTPKFMEGIKQTGKKEEIIKKLIK